MNYQSLLSLLAIFLFSGSPAAGQHNSSAWVDSVYNSLTIEQQISQLFIIRAYSSKDSTYNDSLARIVQQYNPGGLCFFKGSPVKQAALTNLLQQTAQTPLLISIDAEWGLGMRLDSAFSFPRQMALGAIRDDSLIYQMGQMIGKHCRRMGIHINYAPVADINNNPKNPVISFRSFGENRELVTKKSILYMKGMQSEGIMTTAKHFPGHGDTDFDSHYTLPLINYNRQRLDSIELYPFKALIGEGVKGVMIGHLYVPCLDSTPNTATTLSPQVIEKLLKEELGFRGYVVTDALDMQGVTKYYKPGEIEVKAIQAGNDILLLPQNIDIAIAGIKKAIDSGWLSTELIETKCKRILSLKQESGLATKPVINIENLINDLNPPEAKALTQEMVNQSLTLLGNKLRIIPLTGLDRRKIAVISIGDTIPNLFQSTLNRYAFLPVYRVPKVFHDSAIKFICTQLSQYDIVIAGIHGVSSNVADNFGLSRQMIRLIDTITITNRTILAIFGTPYSLCQIVNPDKPEAILVAFQDNQYTEVAAAEALFGGIAIGGKLPVTAGSFSVGSGDNTEKTRLESVFPEEIGISAEALNIIDSIALNGIEAKAYPGCQILLAKDGKIFYDKAFGHPRYEDTIPVTPDHLYDLASVTKVAATTLALMKLYDEGKININDSLGKYLPALRGSNKSPLKIGDVMAHQAGLQDWIPFYKSTLLYSKPDPAIYQPVMSDKFPVETAYELFIRSDYHDSILQNIIASPLRSNRSYKYSDLGFYLLRLIVEQITKQPFDQYLDATFYKPLGLSTTTFNPLAKFPKDRMIPTEYDNDFRKQLVWGYVHDPGAAMLGGVSGHAGLFSNARDLAVILQMLINSGSYGGKEYLKPATVRECTSVWSPGTGNRRGLGFDKPLLNYDSNGPACKGASPISFGHSGFTGTYLWADPSNGLVYIFLSNRVYPDAGNQKLSQMNIRTNIHEAAYKLLQNFNVK